MSSNPQPTQDGFDAWVYAVMGVPLSALPPDSPSLIYAYDVAIAIVNQQLCSVPGPIYMLAVYNLGGDNLVNWCPDQVGSYYPSPPAPPPSTVQAPTTNTGYFAYLRQSWNITGFTPGIVSASYDQGTGQSLVPLEQYKNYTLANLQNTKTPWGRQYLAFAAAVGTNWGIS